MIVNGNDGVIGEVDGGAPPEEKTRREEPQGGVAGSVVDKPNSNASVGRTQGKPVGGARRCGTTFLPGGGDTLEAPDNEGDPTASVSEGVRGIYSLDMQSSCTRPAAGRVLSCRISPSCNANARVPGKKNGSERDSSREDLESEKLQGLQDRAKTMQDACKTPAKPLFDVEGDFLLGGMYRRREEHQILKNPNLVDLLTKHASDDVVLAWREGAALTMLDVDAHVWDDLPTTELLEAVIADLESVPDIWWVTHGRGLKLLYLGTDHRRRALLAATQIPVCFSIELIRNTRHPQSVDTKRPGTRCGEVHFETPSRHLQLAVVRSDVGASDSDRESKLRELGLKEGGRHDHLLCPIDGSSDSDAKGCVVVLPSGVFCHRCAGKGISFRPGMKPGFYPLSGRIRQVSTLIEMARVPVHYTHAEHVLADAYRNLGPRIREEIYRATLEKQLGDDDPRIPLVFDKSLRVIWTEAGWVDPVTYMETTLDNDMASSLPACLAVKKKADPKKYKPAEFSIRRAVRSNLMHRKPDGFPEISIVRGLRFRDFQGPVLQVPDTSPFLRTLLPANARMPVDAAFALLNASFPRISPAYLQVILAAVFCAECGTGRLPMLCVTEPTGAGKGETAQIAASFLGVNTRALQLATPEKFFRSIGSSCALGARIFVVDEFSKAPDLLPSFGALLQINRRITWRPLYSTVEIETPCTAPFIFSATYVAEFLEAAPEFVRRTRAIRLPRTTPEWAQTSGGGSAFWRDRNEEHALAGNSIVSWVFDLCTQKEFQFDLVCDSLGVGRFDADEEKTIREQAARNLFRYCRGDFGSVGEIEQNPSFPRGWIALNTPEAQRFVAELVPDIDWARFPPCDRKKLKYSISAISWPDVLGIDDPVIRADVRVHGRHVGLRFIEDAPLPKGRHRINCELPAVPDELGVAGVADTLPPEPHVTINADASSCKAPPSTEDVLRAGGLL